ncbi:MAG TPA: UTP--glucose-1-phosphate uridylyltransferase [Terriglobales bacterium]|nr:UTP--glucose-1-phosphate uridylyltransferase [Terriglobales bacterium]
MTSASRIRKLVIPAAGLGTRFLPATKVVPKELLPIAGKPLIQFAVEEAAASGIETVILVISSGKGLLAEHFHRDPHLENLLRARGNPQGAELIRRLSKLAEIRTVWQDSPLGLADAIRCARAPLGDEPFAVILPDALIDADRPCIAQLMACYENHPGCVLATKTVESADVGRFGILDLVPVHDPCCGGRVLRVVSLTERPSPESASSRFGIFGRYILEPEIFSCIDHTRPGYGGEFQLTDSLSLCSDRSPVFAYRFEGTHYDAGDKFGYLQASLAYALKDPETAQRLLKYLSTFATLSPTERENREVSA